MGLESYLLNYQASEAMANEDDRSTLCLSGVNTHLRLILTDCPALPRLDEQVGVLVVDHLHDRATTCQVHRTSMMCCD